MGRITACVAALLALACGGEPRDLLLVTVDTLRPDHLGIYGYERDTSPHIDRFFEDGAVFERAYSTSAHTSPSVVSMLTGLYPDEHRVRLFYQLVPEEAVLLPQRLPEGFETAAFVSNSVLTDEALGIAGRFDHYDDFVDERESSRLVYERGARRTTDAVLDWLDARRDPEGRLFVWVHYIDPHGPYRPPEGWRDHFASSQSRAVEESRMPTYQRDPGVSDAFHYVDRYDEEIRYLDAQVGRLLEGWNRRRDLERTLVLFTADHGESMMEHEKWFTHGYHVFEEIVRVPLLIRGPGARRRRSAVPVSGVDVAPTLLGSVGVAWPEAIPGVDLLSESPSEERVVLAMGGSPRVAPWNWLAGIAADAKGMVGVTADGEVVRRHLYDLARDPAELEPLAPQEGDSLIGSLERRAAEDPDPGGVPTEYRRGIQPTAPKVRPGVSPEAEERLRALGYVE